MPHYFFHLHEPNSVSLDEYGIELSNKAAAREYAIAAARDVMRADVATGFLCMNCHIEVTDGSGGPVLDLPYQDAIAISGFGRPQLQVVPTSPFA